VKFIPSCRTIALDGRRAIILFTLRYARTDDDCVVHVTAIILFQFNTREKSG
jgi:hypothetical protein